MCRIAGIIDKKSQQLSYDITLMRDAMKRGGPDSEGVYVDEEASLALGHPPAFHHRYQYMWQPAHEK